MFSLLTRQLISFVSKKHYFCNIETLFKKCVSPSYYPVSFKIRYKKAYVPAALRVGPQPSRYHPGSMIEQTEHKITSDLKDKSKMSYDDWNDLRTELMTTTNVISDENFNGVIMNCILHLNRLDLGQSFITYVENGVLKPNFVILLKYISLLARNFDVVGEEVIANYLNKVRPLLDKSPVLNIQLSEYVIQGLCATSMWRDSFNYMKKLPVQPSTNIYNSIACGAITNNDEKLAWEVLDKWIKPGVDVNSLVIKRFMLVALKLQRENHWRSDKFIQKLLGYMNSRDVVVNVEVIKLIKKYFECHHQNWNISFSKVSRQSICESCTKPLKVFDLTNEEFEYLKRSVLEKIVKKSDLFINTTEVEFRNYIDFIDKTKPFHIVIDGLNASYSSSLAKNKHKLAFHLLRVVQLLYRRSRKLLVLGRSHMKGWPKAPMRKISEKAVLFYTHNISQDDPFVIFAALASGPHTCFLSDDLMRDHMSRLNDPYLILLFKRWQQTHQMYVKVDEEDNINFIEPLHHSIRVQGNMDDGWHIPFDDEIILDPYEELNNWLCIQRVY